MILTHIAQDGNGSGVLLGVMQEENRQLNVFQIAFFHMNEIDNMYEYTLV